MFLWYQASVPGVPDEGDSGDFGTLPASGPLPPHLLVKQETGMTNVFHQYSKVCIFPFMFKLTHCKQKLSYAYFMLDFLVVNTMMLLNLLLELL